MKKILLTAALFSIMLVLVNGQDYNTGLGLRGGPYFAFTVKHFLSEKSAIEGLASTRWKGFEITGLYEIHNQAFEVDRLKWFFGGGGHIGFYNGDNTNWGETGKTYTNIGIDGILGLEYSFNEAPISLSIDWKPSFDVIGYTGFRGDNGALSIRYIF